MQEDKYLNKVEVGCVYTWEEASEEDVFIDIIEKKVRLKCFRGGIGGEPKFVKGEECNVELTLMTSKREKIEDKEKHIHTEERWGTPNHCILKGQIINIYEINGRFGGYDGAIVDCGGIFVDVAITPEDNFKIGDYIKVEGRLDIWKVEEVEKEKKGD